MYDIILFDLDDTLLDFTMSEKQSLVHIHRQYYSTVQYDEFLRAYTDINAKLWARVGALHSSLSSGEVKFLRFQQLNDIFNIPTSSETIALSYEDLLAENADWYPGVKSVIEFLYGKKIVLGIITNGPATLQAKKFKKHQLERWFDCYIVSDSVGYAKPQKEIFQYAINALVNKTTIKNPILSQILMVGDSLSSDGKGAKAYGMDFCYVNKNFCEKISWVTFTVNSVIELPFCLGYKTEFEKCFSKENVFS